jgi:hypothetical protein
VTAAALNNSSACFSWPWESSAVDYEAVYKDIAAILDNNDYDDGSYEIGRAHV